MEVWIWPAVAGAVVFWVLMLMLRVYRGKKLEDAWRTLAQECGGSVVETGEGWFSDESAKALQVRVDGVPVRMDFYSVTSGTGKSRSRVYYQRARVRMPGLMGHTVEIYKESALFSRLGKAMGGQDVVVGDDAFDAAFIVKTNEPDWLIGTLGAERGAPARRAHLAAKIERVTLNGTGMLECIRGGRGGDLATCRAQLELAVGYTLALTPNTEMANPTSSPQLGHEEGPSGEAW